ncbi:MAG: hypothetical protein HY650_03570 [Acidobacteria bacterium]|nr:hypothetical protein [Acidobacteriota bacterium]
MKQRLSYRLLLGCLESGRIHEMGVRGRLGFLMIGLTLLAGFAVPNDGPARRPSPSAPAARRGDYALILMSHTEAKAANRTRDYVVSQGGEVAIVSPPHVMIRRIAPALAERLAGKHGIESVTYTSVDPASLKYQDSSTRNAVKLFNAARLSGGGPAPTDPKRSAQQVQPLINDARHVLGIRPYALENSEVMTGSVAVALLFVESDGSIDSNTHTWTDAAHDEIYGQVGAGLAWWSSQASARGLSLSFTLVDYPPTLPAMNQGYEPILHSSEQDGLWISRIMANLGYVTGDAFDRVAAYNNGLKAAQGIDWAYSVVIGYNPAPAPTTFTDGYFAYAYIGCPYTQVLYRNDGYGVGNFGLVLTHETGHIFWACDEYYQAGYGGCTSCGACEPGGPRPSATNANCEFCNPGSVNCMMRENAYALCAYTPWQIGWSTAPDFNYGVTNSGSINATHGSSGATTITATLLLGSPQAVSWSVSGLPASTSSSFSPGSCNPTCSGTLTINAGSSAPVGTYTITVTGSPLNRTTTFELNVSSAGGCAATAAVQGTADAEETLSLAYRFQDEVLARSTRGQEYARQFYQFSPEAVRIMRSQEGIFVRHPILAKLGVAICPPTRSAHCLG